MPSFPDPATARRRRAFVGALAILVLLLGAVLAFAPHGSSTAPTAAVAGTPPRTGTTQAPSEPATSPIPTAYLAWMSGGFPSDFRARVRTLPGIDRSVVVAGDTRWMTASHDASGAVVDRPTPPFAIPIDAFAVNPQEYAPFLPASVRTSVVTALQQGKAVLGEASASLRQIGPGGTMTFGDRTVTVGAVAPDDAVGWSEMLVSRDVGAQLGIVDERYLLVQLQGSPRDAAFGRSVETLLPADTLLRVAHTGETPFLRVASGVDPPVVMKERFGEFAAHPDPADPAYLTMDPAWVAAHIQTRTVPLLGRMTCNRALFPALIASLRAVEQAGLSSEIRTNSGCYAARTVARSPTAPPSQHAYGAAVDINAPENAYGATPTMDPRIVRIFETHDFLWGGNFLIPDGMHFEAYAVPAGAKASNP